MEDNKKPNWTSEDIARIMKEEGAKISKRFLDKLNGNVAPKVRTGKCRVCGGKITEDWSKVYDPSSGPPIYGPGSRSQYMWKSSGLGCVDCGIAYKKMPKDG